MKRGFTLLELLIVVAILIVLAQAIVPLFSTTRRQAQDSKALSDLQEIRLASLKYRFDTGSWPQNGSTGDDTCLVAMGTGCPGVSDGWLGPYLTTWAGDPYGNNTPYRIFVCGTTQFVQSFGPDAIDQNCNPICNATDYSACDICMVTTTNIKKSGKGGYASP